MAPSPPLVPSSNESPTSVSGAQAAASWPSWFKDAHQLLSSEDLGPEFTSLIDQLTKFEKLTDFENQVHAQQDSGWTNDRQRSAIGFLEDA